MLLTKIEEQAYFALADHVGVIREAEFYGHLLSDFDPITPYNIIIPAAPIDLTSPTERCKMPRAKRVHVIWPCQHPRQDPGRAPH